MSGRGMSAFLLGVTAFVAVGVARADVVVSVVDYRGIPCILIQGEMVVQYDGLYELDVDVPIIVGPMESRVYPECYVDVGTAVVGENGAVVDVEPVGGAVLKTDAPTRLNLTRCASRAVGGGTAIHALIGRFSCEHEDYQIGLLGLKSYSRYAALSLKKGEGVGVISAAEGTVGTGRPGGTVVSSPPSDEPVTISATSFGIGGGVMFLINGGANKLSGGEKIAIYNVRGELIDEVNVDNSTAGVKWNGCDRRGARVGSGVYFARFLTGRNELARAKFVLLH